MSLLAVENLSVRLGGRVLLDGVSLHLGRGEVFGLVGESGSGKSMTALAVLGLLPEGTNATGRVMLAGTDLLGLPEAALCAQRGNRVGMIFQEPMTALNPLMTIGDQVAETLRLHRGLGRRAAQTAARDRLDRVGLPSPRFALGLYPHELSGGQRQRVAISMAIAARPALLIADEPTTALDVTTQAQILTLLRDLVRDEGMGLLLISHDLAVVAGMAQRVAVMQAGRIVEDGPPSAVFGQPAHPYTAALMAAARHRPSPAAQRPGPPLLQVAGVSRRYLLPRSALFGPQPAVQALNAVSLTLHEGESLGLVGESGCGKSTLARAILGLERVQTGTIRLAGAQVQAGAVPATLRAQIQAVFQDPYGSFNPRHRVARLLAEPFHLTGRPADWRDRVAEALREVDLSPDDATRHIHEFSGGQRQRLAIARALIIRPRLIVLDEAVSALDLRVRAQVLDLLARLRNSHRLAYLFISHDLGVIRGLVDRVAVMRAGQIVELAPTEQIFTAPAHPYTRSLLAATPPLPAERAVDKAPRAGV